MVKHLFIKGAFLCLVYLGGASRLTAQNIALDKSFGESGIVTTDFDITYSDNSIKEVNQVIPAENNQFFVLFSSNTKTVLSKHLKDGSLDKSYGQQGFSYPANSFLPIAASVQSSDKIIVVTNEGNKFKIVRFNTNGIADKTFISNGLSTNTAYYASSIAVQNDGKIVVGGLSAEAGETRFTVARFLSDGGIDKGFGESGIRSINFNSVAGELTTLKIQKDGKILVAGYAYNGNDYDFAIARINQDGNFDQTFASGGKAIFDFKGSNSLAFDLAIQEDNKLIVGGYDYTCTLEGCSQADVILARFNTDGKLDNSFGANGISIKDFGSFESIKSVLIKANGKVVVTGSQFSIENGSNFFIAQFLSDGKPDLAFSNHGINTSALFNPKSLVVENTSTMLVAGNSEDGLIGVARLNDNGSLNNSLGRDGKLFINNLPTSGVTEYKSLAIQNDGKILTTGYTVNNAHEDYAIARYNQDGSLDQTFSKEGKNAVDFGNGNERGEDIIIQKNGKIIVCGNGGGNFSLVRYNADGTFDNSFGKDGKIETVFLDGYISGATFLKLQDDRKILAGGYTYDPNKVDNNGFNIKKLAIVRYNEDGTLDDSFESANIMRSFSSNGTFNIKMAVQEDNKILVAISQEEILRGSSEGNIIVFRLMADGNPDPSFNNGGPLIYSNEQLDILKLLDMALLDDGKILLSGYSPSVSELIVLLKLNNDGSFDKTFGDNGVSMDYDNSANFSFKSMSIENDGKIIISGSNFSGDFLLTRYLSNGTKDNTFEENGAYIKNIFFGQTNVNKSIWHNNQLYLVGNTNIVQEKSGLIARYNLAEGAPGTTVTLSNPFDGKVYYAPGPIKLKSEVTGNSSPISKVEFYSGTTLLHTEYKTPYTYTYENVAAGTYQFTAKATDKKGDVYTSAISNVEVLTNQTPVVSLTTRTGASHFEASSNINFIAIATDQSRFIKKVDFYNGTTLVHTEIRYPYTYRWVNVPAGNHTLTAVATDNFGLSATSAQLNITVGNTLLITKSSANDEKEKNSSLRLSVSPNPATSVILVKFGGFKINAQSHVTILSSTGTVMQTRQPGKGANQVNLNVSGLKPGNYLVRINNGSEIFMQQFIKL